MATAKQKAWRAKFARLYGGGRKKARRSYVGRVVRHYRRKVSSMARRGRRSYRRGGGTNSLIKGAVIGFVASMVAPKILPNVDPKLVGAGAAYLMTKNVMAAGAGYVAPMLLGGLGGSANGGDPWA